MSAILLVGTLFLSGAEPQANAADAAEKKANRLICRTVGTTGSRLGGQRVCMTAAQWEERKRATRATIDRAQTQQINKSGT
jgi:hypothetical protein